MPFEMGAQFASEKRDWIIEHRQTLDRIAPATIYNEAFPFSSRTHTIWFERRNIRCVQLVKAEGGYKMLFPLSVDINSPQAQQQIRNVIVEMLRLEARNYLPQRTAMLAGRHNLQYHSVAVKNTRSRWGSCSSTNNINLSIHLMRLPEHLSDFVILHELCHTVHKNHGAGFHQMLDYLTGGREKKLDNELKKFKIQL